jgi:pimeloyl-ACP methyl ester carboxylesterase
MKPRERMIAIRDGAVRFRVLSGGRGPSLVYLHSCHDRSVWPPLVERLAERFTVHTPLHPGVQGSEGVEHLDDVIDLGLAYDELLGALRLESTLVAGHFFGAMVAAELAALCPGRVRKLCLISPLGLWIDAKPVADVLVLPSAQLDGLLWSDPESEAARTWRTWPEDEEANAAAQVEQIQRLAVMGKFVWPIPDKGLKKRLHRVTAPTLILWGDDDRVNPDAYGGEFARRIRKARVERLVGGHMLHLESMRAVAAAMTEFFLSARGATARARAPRRTGSSRRTRRVS